MTQQELESIVKRSTHSRYRRWCGRELVTFYGRDPDSPTGVSRIGGAEWSQELEDAIRAIDSRICPLSPTEGLCLPANPAKFQQVDQVVTG